MNDADYYLVAEMIRDHASLSNRFTLASTFAVKFWTRDPTFDPAEFLCVACNMDKRMATRALAKRIEGRV